MNLISFGVHLGKHGQKKKGKYDGGVAFLALLLVLFLYYKAGIFNNF
tara:strand:- start:17261 stop:17401 length:141 start_codon:yes stop_codon:yes gene_type:complete